MMVKKLLLRNHRALCLLALALLALLVFVVVVEALPVVVGESG